MLRNYLNYYNFLQKHPKGQLHLHLSNTANTYWNTPHPHLTFSVTWTDQNWCTRTILSDFSQHKSSITFYCITLHLPESLSSGAQQPADSAHTCQHLTVAFLLSATALIDIYLQTNSGRKVSVPASALRVMTGIKVPPSLPSLGESYRTADKTQISSDIAAVACYHDQPSVLNQNVSIRAWQDGWSLGRRVWREPDRGPPLFPPSWTMPVCDILHGSHVLHRDGTRSLIQKTDWHECTSNSNSSPKHQTTKNNSKELQKFNLMFSESDVEPYCQAAH